MAHRRERTLPPELWSRIASFASRTDVLNLMRTSKLLHSASEMVLYRDITLSSSPKAQVDRTFARLGDRNLGLGRFVSCLKLEKLEELKFSSVPFTAMANLYSLSILKCDMFWKTTEEQKRFLARLKAACPSLRKLSINIREPNPHSDFSIPNLTHVTWVERALSPSILSLCIASRETITHLSIDFIEYGQLSTIKSFLKLHFPKLTSLELGPGPRIYPRNDESAVRAAFRDFLLRHASITHLRLFYELNDNEGDVYLSPPHSYKFPEGILPRLEHLSAHPDFIQALLKSGVRFFHTTLRTLAVEDGLYLLMGAQLLYLFKGCIKYTRRTGKRLSVRRLRLMTRTNPDGEMLMDISYFKRRMGVAAEALPDLEVWEGDVPDQPPNVDDLRSMFSKFRKLREITMYSTIAFGYADGAKYEASSEEDSDEDEGYVDPDEEEYYDSDEDENGGVKKEEDEDDDEEGIVKDEEDDEENGIIKNEDQDEDGDVIVKDEYADDAEQADAGNVNANAIFDEGSLHADMISIALACPVLQVLNVGDAEHRVRDTCVVSRGATLTEGVRVLCVCRSRE